MQARRPIRWPARVGSSRGRRDVTRAMPSPVLAVLLVLAGAAGVLLLISGVILQAENGSSGHPWRTGLVVLLCVRFAGVVLAMGVGLWWWWRAPANPTGRLLYLAGVCDCVFMIGAGWPYTPWAVELKWAQFLVLPLVAMIVLGWPTGRPSRTIRRVIIGVTAGAVVIDLVSGVFWKSPYATEEWPNQPHAFFWQPVVFQLIDPIRELMFIAVPAIVGIVVLVRQRRAVPPAVRPLITPITVAGVLVAGSLVVRHVGFQMFRELIAPDGDNDLGTIRVLSLLGAFLCLAFVAVGVLIGASRRRRAVGVGKRQMVVDLRSATPVVSPSAAAGAVLGDPSAVVRYQRADGRWIGSSGDVLDAIPADRRLLPVVDEGSNVVAGLEVGAATPVPPLLADLAVSTIAAQSANERAAALADARRREVRERSRELVAAADAGRIALERNLHDGAQQLLVGLALTAGLQARREGPDEHTTGAPSPASAGLITHLNQVRSDILELIDSGTPAALSAGLAEALRSLAMISPISVSFHADGDLPVDDPLAVDLYLAVGEALTNAVKHSGANGITIVLAVDAETVRIVLRDNGIGGLSRVPHSLTRRVESFRGSVHVHGLGGHGTTVTITAWRTTGGRR